MLEEHRQSYVLAVRSNYHLRFIDQESFVETDPKTIAEDLPAEAWMRLAAGEGAKGLRLYDWARIALPWSAANGFERWLMIRRSCKEPDSLIIWSLPLKTRPSPNWPVQPACAGRSRNASSAPRTILVSTIASAFMARLAPPHEPRHGRRRILRQAGRLLAPRRLEQTERNESNRGHRRLNSMVALVPTMPEIRYLLARLLLRPPISASFVIEWSLWRRQHQADAAIAHKRRSNAQL